MATTSVSKSQRALAWAKENPNRRKEIEQKYRQSEKYDLTRRNREYIKRYGITLEEYNLKVISQNNCCALCGEIEQSKSLSINRETKPLFVDHDHNTGKVRGLLCTSCNTLLGNSKDNIELLQKAINYLKEYS